MTKRVFMGLLATASGLVLAACSAEPVVNEAASGFDGHGHGHGAESAGEEYERGPHGGRMLRVGDLALEVTIFEAGVEPQFRLYPFFQNEPLDPASVSASIDLIRLGGQVDRFRFTAEGDVLVGDGVVTEPHSFDVQVRASANGVSGHWEYESHEGRTVIARAQADAAGVAVEAVGPVALTQTVDVYGVTDFWPHARVDVRGWLPGRVTAMDVTVGDTVRAGQRLAQITATESLRSYAVTSPINGVVLERHAAVGGPTGAAPLYVIGDPEQMHAELFVYSADLTKIDVGQPVSVRSLDGARVFEGVVEGVMPSLSASSQRAVVHVDMPNPEGVWRAGERILAAIEVGQRDVDLAVRTEALQRFRDFTVVYTRVDDTYEVRMLELGEQTPEWTEVLGGIAAGAPYVTENPFLITADVLKSGATHDH